MKLRVVGKSGMGKDICFVSFGKFKITASNDFKKHWTKADLLEGFWTGEWLIHTIRYSGFDLDFRTSNEGLALIRKEWKQYKRKHAK